MRLFIAIDLPPTVHRHLLQFIKGVRTHPSINWSKSSGWHLTLLFLGECEPSKVADLISILTPVAMRSAPFSLQLKNAGVFPRPSLPRVFWVGIDSPDSGLLKLAEEVQTACEKMGFKRENKPFAPHLTVGRMKQNQRPGINRNITRQFCKIFSNYQSDQFTVVRFYLIQSHLGAEGAHYETLHSFPLKSA